MSKTRSIKLNMIGSLLLQLAQIVSALVIPRLIIQTFGSDVNGLVASITQFLNYIALIEGGVASVMMANLYKPLLEGNDEKLSGIFAAMRKFFGAIAKVLIVYQLALGAIYPLIVDTGYSWEYVFSLTLILGAIPFIKYNFSISYRLLLDAGNRIYVTALVQAFVVVATMVLVYASILVYPSIHVLKLVTVAVLLVQPLGFRHFARKHYSIDMKAKPDDDALSQRWDGLGISLAYFVHGNTDIVILTFLASLKDVSVYSVYLMVFTGVRSIVGAITSSFSPTLGMHIAKGDKKELNGFFDLYEFISESVSYLAFAYAWILIIPFMAVYMGGITDADYNQPIFATVLAAAELAYCARNPYIDLEYQWNQFKKISKYAYGEAVLNLLISIPAVIAFGLPGAAMGTLASVLYRAVASVAYMKRELLDRSWWICARYQLVFLSMSIVSYLVTNAVVPDLGDAMLNLFATAGVGIAVLFALYFAVTALFYRSLLIAAVKHFIPRVARSNC